MGCCFEGASDSKIAFPKSMSIGWYILFTSVRIMLSLFISLWGNLYECKCSIASHNFSTLCSPQNTVKGTWIYLAGHGTKYKKNNIVKMVKI